MKVAASLAPYLLETIPVPRLIMAARDDGLGTYVNAEHTASRKPSKPSLPSN